MDRIKQLEMEIIGLENTDRLGSHGIARLRAANEELRKLREEQRLEEEFAASVAYMEAA